MSMLNSVPLSFLMPRLGPSSGSRLLRLSVAARRIGVCERTVRRWIHRGKIRAKRTLGGHFRISEREIENKTRTITDTSSSNHSS